MRGIPSFRGEGRERKERAKTAIQTIGRKAASASRARTYPVGYHECSKCKQRQFLRSDLNVEPVRLRSLDSGMVQQGGGAFKTKAPERPSPRSIQEKESDAIGSTGNAPPSLG